jgi:hypothetical protein
MYRIYVVNGDEKLELKLPEDFAPDFEVQNPATEYGEISAGASLDHDIPADGNEVALRFANHLETDGGDLLFDVEAYNNDVLEMRGKLLVEQSTWRSFQDTINVSIIATDFPSIISNVKLRDWCSETIEIADEPTDVFDGMADINSNVYPDVACFFPTYYNIEHFAEGNEAFTGIINPWSQADQEFTGLGNVLNVETNLYDNLYDYSPWMYLKWVLDKLSDASGYRFSGTAYNDADFSRITIPSNLGLGKKSDKGLLIATTTAAQALVNEKIDFDNEVDDSENACTPGINPYTITAAGIHQVRLELNVANFTGASVIVYFKTGGTTGTGLQWTITEQNEVAILEGTVTFDAGDIGTSMGVFCATGGINLVTINSNSRIKVFNTTESSIIEIPKSFNAGNALPDMSIATFFNVLRSWLNIRIKINPSTRDVVFDWCKDIMAKTPVAIDGVVQREFPIEHRRARRLIFSLSGENPLIDAANYIGEFDTQNDIPESVVGQIAFVRNFGCYLVYDLDLDDRQIKWKLYSASNSTIVVGDGEDYQISISGKCINMREIVFDDARMLVPQLTLNAVTESNQNNSIKELYLAFVFGAQNGSVDEYPAASVSHLNMNGDAVTEWPLYLSDGTFGTVEQLYDDWIRVIRATKLLTKLVLPTGSISKYLDAPITYDNQIYILDSFYSRAGKSNESVEFRLLRI